ncbi:DEAD/DEAH box helicase family protein [Streptomyces flavidovirens]|uniref:DEAD/DEAH box helicase family protein n=1 Tax=Streptomyces flavidovirens TaxID=67298 RepID=UPI003F571847
MAGVCSLRSDEALGFPSTTDTDEFVEWTHGQPKATVFATYASLGTLERAHQAGLEPWDLIVIDEAHRVSGRIGKPWAAVHDNTKIPAASRLYMTATPRLWQASEAEDNDSASSGRGSGELVAAMDPHSPVFGTVAYELGLSTAIDAGIIAPYQVVCVDVADPLPTLSHAAGLSSRSRTPTGRPPQDCPVRDGAHRPGGGPVRLRETLATGL